MLFLTALLTLNINLFATTWSQLNVGKNYILGQPLSLSQKERSHSSLDLHRGEDMILKEITLLPPVNVMLFSFKYKNCPGKEMESEMQIMSVQQTLPMVEVGVQLVEKCELQVLIPKKDLTSKSLFE